jgi:Flp pilus assembly protein TadD
VGQALKVRPYQGPILFAAGREAMMIGQVPLALQLWRRASAQDHRLQKQIISVLVRHVPASVLVAQLQPDIAAMGVIFSHYQSIEREEQARVVGQSYVAMLEQAARRDSGEQSARRWRHAFNVHRMLGNTDRAVWCLRESVTEAPTDFSLRQTLASVLYAQQQYRQAHEHLLWCVRRKPHDGRIRAQLRDTEARMESSSALEVAETEGQPPVRR